MKAAAIPADWPGGRVSDESIERVAGSASRRHVAAGAARL